MHLGDSETLVAVDGVELSEFAVEYSADGKEASCWIPSECGKNFSINWEYTNASGLTVDALVWVNGTSCGRKFMSRHRTRPHNLSGCRTSVATSADTRRPLLFARQALTDYDNLLGAAISPELGSIKVEVRNVRKVPRRVKQPPPWAVHSYETPVLHEKSKKAIGHTVQFGAEFAAVNNAPKVRAKFIGELGTFSFKYRPIRRPPESPRHRASRCRARARAIFIFRRGTGLDHGRRGRRCRRDRYQARDE